MDQARRRVVVPVTLMLLVVTAMPGPLDTVRAVDAATSPFTDIAGSMFKADIEWLYAEGITTGCTPTTYCPDNQVYRDEMASFLARMFKLPPTPNDYFTDDEGNIHQDDINRVAAAGITLGCYPATHYCPHGIVQRDHIAAFIARAIPLTIGDGRNYFRDDHGSQFEEHIDRAGAAGIATGCGTWRYCPGGKYTRGQMAAFLHRVEAPLPAGPYPAPAAGLAFYVTTTGVDAANDCLAPAKPCRTVRYAIGQTIEGDKIVIGPGTYREQPLSLPHGLDLVGDPGGGTTIDASGNAAPVFWIAGDVSVGLDHLILKGGLGAIVTEDLHYGGVVTIVDSALKGDCGTCHGIVTRGKLKITSSTISGYRDGTWGSTGVSITSSTISGNVEHGVYGGGPATITNSTISGNGGFGVKIGTGPVTITNSTISGNGGAGIDCSSGKVTGSTVAGNGSWGVCLSGTIANSTVTGNKRGGGAWAWSGSHLTIINSTIAANTSNYAGAGVHGDVSLKNTIVSGNTALATGIEDPTNGQVQKLASIVGIPAGLTLADILDPAGLADHGGPTKTIALVNSATNPALDKGDAATCAAAPVSGLDQRGLPRTPPCDIGAYELQP